MENNIEVVTRITFLFFIYLVLALFVERLVEVLISAANYIELKKKLHEFWTRRAKVYQKRFDRLYGFQGENAPKTQKVLNWVLWKVMTDPPYPGGKEIISADLIRLNYYRVGTRVLAFLVSLIFAVCLKKYLDIDLLSIIAKVLPGVKIVNVVAGSDFLSVILTAAAVSIGSEPLHQVISRVEKIGERKQATASGGAQ